MRICFSVYILAACGLGFTNSKLLQILLMCSASSKIKVLLRYCTTDCIFREVIGLLQHIVLILFHFVPVVVVFSLTYIYSFLKGQEGDMFYIIIGQAQDLAVL